MLAAVAVEAVITVASQRRLQMQQLVLGPGLVVLAAEQMAAVAVRQVQVGRVVQMVAPQAQVGPVVRIVGPVAPQVQVGLVVRMVAPVAPQVQAAPVVLAVVLAALQVPAAQGEVRVEQAEPVPPQHRW